MIVLGIDPGTKLCGWARLDIQGRRPTWLGGGRDELGDIASWNAALWRVDMVVVEKPAALHRAQANGNVIGTAFAAGVAFGMFFESDFDSYVVSPQQVRAALVGVAKRGNQDAAVKRVLERIIAGAPKRWNDHMRDAAAAAIVGHRMYQRRAA